MSYISATTRTILKSSIFHSICAVALISDICVCVCARWIDDANLNVIPSFGLSLGPGVHNEVCCHLPENPLSDRRKGK